MENILKIIFLVIWLFPFIHAVQHIRNEKIRVSWTLFFIFGNIITSIIYLCTKYRVYLKRGEGWLLIKNENHM